MVVLGVFKCLKVAVAIRQEKKILHIVDKSTENGVSFSGQGHSDAFHEIYAEQIIAMQDNMRNMSTYNDFANIIFTERRRAA